MYLRGRMNLDEAIDILKTGYCLWVGAGIPIQLAGRGAKVHTWETLVESLEQSVKIEYPQKLKKKLDFPERLKIIFDHPEMGRYNFAVKIRESVCENLAFSILKNAHNQEPDTLPAEFLQIATLGHLANPIVNFNIETLSSIALAGTHNKDCSLKVFKIPDIDDKLNHQLDFGIPTEFYLRHVIHPHGAINSHGRCILTSDEYSSLNGTLALQVSAHAAFNSNLVIVGMSLDDKYLRKQLAKFRQQIGKILWFMTETDYQKLSNSTLSDATVHNFTFVIFKEWAHFWQGICEKLKKPNTDKLKKNYISLLESCANAHKFSGRQLFSLLLDDKRGNYISFDDKKRDEINHYFHHASLLMSAYHRGERLPSDEEYNEFKTTTEWIKSYFELEEHVMAD